MKIRFGIVQHPKVLKKCGKYSYGYLNVASFGGKDERLEIGEFVSIANEVLFVTGGEHPLDHLMTFPWEYHVLGKRVNGVDAPSKGPIIVGDDVWIGTRATILSGVRIGQGAMIGAGSVVASDVAPYSVVAGNPAREIRKRFPEQIISKLMGITKRLTPAKMREFRDLLNQPLTEKSLLLLTNGLS